MNRTHWISALVPFPDFLREARNEIPPRLTWLNVGKLPTTTGEDGEIVVCATVDALNPSDAMARLARVFPSSRVQFCSPKPTGWRPNLSTPWGRAHGKEA